jgi:hypothetical protein
VHHGLVGAQSRAQRTDDLPDIEWIEDHVVEPHRRAAPGAVVRLGGGPPRMRPRTAAPTGVVANAGTAGLGGPTRPRSVGFGPGFTVVDPAVHRRLRRPADEALTALERLHRELLAGATARHGSWVRWGRRRAWLAFDDPAHGIDEDGCRVAARLRVPWSVRLVEVELVVEPWSASWTELRLQLAGHRSVWRLPHRYFDTAHPLMASLRDALAASA